MTQCPSQPKSQSQSPNPSQPKSQNQSQNLNLNLNLNLNPNLNPSKNPNPNPNVSQSKSQNPSQHQKPNLSQQPNPSPNLKHPKSQVYCVSDCYGDYHCVVLIDTFGISQKTSFEYDRRVGAVLSRKEWLHLVCQRTWLQDMEEAVGRAGRRRIALLLF
jgi:hypothetical protein